jgi:hypothetical protein
MVSRAQNKSRLESSLDFLYKKESKNKATLCNMAKSRMQVAFFIQVNYYIS